MRRESRDVARLDVHRAAKPADPQSLAKLEPVKREVAQSEGDAAARESLEVALALGRPLLAVAPERVHVALERGPLDLQRVLLRPVLLVQQHGGTGSGRQARGVSRQPRGVDHHPGVPSRRYEGQQAREGRAVHQDGQRQDPLAVEQGTDGARGGLEHRIVASLLMTRGSPVR